MNWLALVIMWAGAIISSLGCYRLGKANGHIEGHICETLNRSIQQLEEEANGND